jgi:hypothetical protein
MYHNVLYDTYTNRFLETHVSHPVLMFCPYLELRDPVHFADWTIGPAEAFADRWADEAFKTQGLAFLAKFVDVNGERRIAPSLLCPRDGTINGELRSAEELEALQGALSFGFLDRNPRHGRESQHDTWQMLTADNTELHVWPVDVTSGYVTVTTGAMIRTRSGGWQISDSELIIRPPLELHMPLGAQNADSDCLEAVYRILLASLQAPGTNRPADRFRAAMGWFVKAWRNTPSVHFEDRVVFLKTGFEALTGSSKAYRSANALRQLFESLRPNVHEDDTERLIWAPNEVPRHTRTWTTDDGRQHTEQITDLQHWFMAFAEVRNTIIHDGIVPSLQYAQDGSAYDGHYVFTAEFLLRAALKVALGPLGYPNLWKSPMWRAARQALEDLERRNGEEPDPR